jgi:cyclic pyranopterin phosphate synthase
MDTLGRSMRDIRISVTDRCNFRCTYCMPREVFGKDYEFLPRSELLTFEEIETAVRVLARLGVHKVRLTGGEPLLRRGIEDLVSRIAAIEGIDDLALTTNGSLLARKAPALADAGLSRVTVSLDSVDDTVFRAMSDVDFPVSRVLEAIDVAADAGLNPVKVNTVVQRGVNDHQIVDMARAFRGTGHIVRFIEYMDVGTSNGWRMDEVVPVAEIVETISQQWPIEPVPGEHPGDVANRWRYLDGAGEVGMIGSVTEPFCGDCTRLRLSSEGRLYTCLFATGGTDLRGPLRNGATEAEIESLFTEVWTRRTDRYSEERSGIPLDLPKVEMSYIGG